VFRQKNCRRTTLLHLARRTNGLLFCFGQTGRGTELVHNLQLPQICQKCSEILKGRIAFVELQNVTFIVIVKGCKKGLPTRQRQSNAVRGYRMYTLHSSTLSQKKVPTFKMSVTLSNLNRFANFYIAEKRTKFAIKPYDITHFTLGMLLHYLGKLKIQIFCRCGRKHKQTAF